MHVDYFYLDENNERQGVRGNTFQSLYLSPQDGYLYLLSTWYSHPLKMCKPDRLLELNICDE